MDLSKTTHLHGYLQAAASSTDSEERACARNFLLDERPPADAADLYSSYFGAVPVRDLDAWYGRHGDYARDHLYLDSEEALRPWTFRPENARNRISQIDRRLNLIRVEQAEWPCSLRGHAFEEVARQVHAFHNGDAAARDFLESLCDAWNAERDLRPAYVTTEIQVEDILADGVEDWAVRLRDRLGLGHMDPGPSKRPIEILLMRYTVDEVVGLLDGEGHPAIPTVLDGSMSCYFFPSPLPKPDATEAPLYGRTVKDRKSVV